MSDVLIQIREGMTVRDRDGNDLGKVDFVHFSDEDPGTPGPETLTAGADPREDRHSILDVVADALGAHHVPEELRQRLLRNGFLRVDRGLFGHDRYVLPDQIASVRDGEVILSASRDDLVRRV